ncbi:MAG: XRE family transcriptional regulator [Oscillospiraceae bacterium]|nr:XRE family transcriptional regulator [Oscillospiraceae bacterium]
MININGHDFTTLHDIEKELFTPEEIAEAELKAEFIKEIIKARQEKGLTQQQLGELSGVKQPVIARMEKGSTSPQLSTVMKVLASLGMKLAIVPIDSSK